MTAHTSAANAARFAGRGTLRITSLVKLAVLLVGLASCGHSAGGADRNAAAASDAPLPQGIAPGESLAAFDSTFTDQLGHPVRLADYRGRPVVLAMIYTRCTSACPLLLANLKRIESQLPANARARTWFVLASLDPEHDAPDTLAAFARSRGLDPARWRLLTGSRAATTELAALLGVRVRQEADGAIAHSSNVYLLDREGVVRHALVGLDADPAELVAARAALR